MQRLVRFAGLAAFVVLDWAESAQAGMPMGLLSDVARMRFQTISFFLACFLSSAWGVGRIWNSLSRDFPVLPHLTYRKALGLVALWGLLFALILTMISGARELMTPGAWKKQGFTYKLAEDVAPAAMPGMTQETERRFALDRLRAALWTYARHHEGHFPSGSAPPEIPDDAWLVPDPSGMRFIYRPGFVADRGAIPLAFEPGIFGRERLVLLTSGQIVKMAEDELQHASHAKDRQ
jgi:hypothetical protein